MKPRAAIFNRSIIFGTCFVSIILVACDQNNSDEQVELGLEMEQAAPVNQPKADGSKQDELAVPTRQNNVAIAPGNIVVLALSTYDARAVVKSAQGELQAMQPGDVVQGTETVLIDILEDRLVFEEVVTKPSGLKVKETVWVYKARDGVSRVRVLSRNSPESSGISVKKTIVVSE